MALQNFSLEIAAVIPAVQAAALPNCACTIQTRTNTVDPTTGQPDLSDWTDVAGLTALQAMAGIQRPAIPNITATVREPQQFDTQTQVHVTLMGFYPGVLQQNQAVLVGGPYAGSYEIMAVESDSQQTHTRLALRVWTL